MSHSGSVDCYDIHDRAEEFRERYFDIVFMFDVSGHIADEDRLLTSFKFHLAPHGCIAINVPAQQWVHSDYDRGQGHYRRYSIDYADRIFGALSRCERVPQKWIGASVMAILDWKD